MKTKTKKHNKKRKIGILEGKATCKISKDFKITDEELISL